MYSLFQRKQFKKDLKNVLCNLAFDSTILGCVLNRLAEGEKLEEKYLNHSLKGEFKNCFECHVQPDILFIYALDKKEKVIYLIRIGSHSDLF